MLVSFTSKLWFTILTIAGTSIMRAKGLNCRCPSITSMLWFTLLSWLAPAVRTGKPQVTVPYLQAKVHQAVLTVGTCGREL